MLLYLICTLIWIINWKDYSKHKLIRQLYKNKSNELISRCWSAPDTTYSMLTLRIHNPCTLRWFILKRKQKQVNNEVWILLLLLGLSTSTMMMMMKMIMVETDPINHNLIRPFKWIEHDVRGATQYYCPQWFYLRWPVKTGHFKKWWTDNRIKPRETCNYEWRTMKVNKVYFPRELLKFTDRFKIRFYTRKKEIKVSAITSDSLSRFCHQPGSQSKQLRTAIPSTQLNIFLSAIARSGCFSQWVQILYALSSHQPPSLVLYDAISNCNIHFAGNYSSIHSCQIIS